MSYEQRNNSGAIFRNDAERMAGRSESFPTHSGNALIGGREYYISAWVKNGRNGKFFSLAFNPKNEAAKPSGKRQESKPVKDCPQPDRGGFTDDDIPFAPLGKHAHWIA